MPRILPREGLYIDPIVSLLQSTLLNPLLTTPAAYLEYFGLRHSRAAKSLVILGLIYRINSFLNKCANNNWRLGRSDWNWEKELVLVTGGSSGIGASVARQLANKGINVVVLDVQPLTYDSHPKITFFQCDIRSEAEVQRVGALIKSQLGDPTVILNNAGIAMGDTPLGGRDLGVRKTFDVNIISHFHMIREFLPALIKKNHGHVITISSLSAFFAIPELVDYAVSKAAAMAFHEGVGLELSRVHKASRVRTTCLLPSFIRTPLFNGEVNQMGFFLPLLHVDTVADRVVAHIISGRSGGKIYIPKFVALLGCVRSFPPWLAWILNQVATKSKWNPT